MLRRSHAFTLACRLLLALAASATAAAGQEVKLDAPAQKIAAASFVRARSAPEFAASEVARLKLGTVVSAVARTAEQAQIGERRDYWYRVELPGGAPAWVFGGLLADYDPARRAEIARQLIEGRMKVEGMSFEDGVDFYNFVAAALAEARDPGAKGELELYRLHAVDRAARLIPYDERTRPPYREFHAAHEREIFYHELAGAWYARPDAFWALERKYAGTPLGDRIAWDAAQALIGGECEGDEVCSLHATHQTEGKYLSRYPRGAHAAEVLQNLARALESTELDRSLKAAPGVDAADGRRELRASVAKSEGAEKAAILKRLDQLLAIGGAGRAR